MAEAEIKFEREGIEGIIPVGSYLGDALRRFGIRHYEKCSEEHDCVVDIVKGADLLSPATSEESARLTDRGNSGSRRLACHARIESEGEIVIMTQEPKEAPKPEETESDQYRKQFAELPLDQKISELVKLEALALGDTVSFIVNSPFAIFEKVGDMMAGFGMKLEKQAKEAQRPEEHTSAAAGSPKRSTRKKKPDTDENL
jgi:ferredoxin